MESVDSANLELETFRCKLFLKKEEFEEFGRKMKIHNARLKKSLKYRSIFHSEKRDLNILKIIQESCNYIKNCKDDFYEFEKQWKEFNDQMKQTSKLHTMLKEENAHISDSITGSLYLLIVFQNVSDLDSFWNGYIDGKLKEVFCSAVLPQHNRTSDLYISISFTNYMAYRDQQFVGKTHDCSGFFA